MHLALILALLATDVIAQTALPDLAPGIQATPRLPEPTPAAALINAQLTKMDRLALDVLPGCTPGPDNDYRRGVTVTLDSPAYVTLLISEGGFCTGAAHPWSFTYPITFDRKTGAQFDPMTWLPPNLTPGPLPEPWSIEADLARHEPLTTLYLSLLQPDPAPLLDCPHILQSVPHGFDLWPDAASKSLMIEPSGLPYMDDFCTIPVALPLSLLQSQNFAPALRAALAQ